MTNDASSFRNRQNAVYGFAKLDIFDSLQRRGAFTLQTLIFEVTELNGLQSGKWNMTRLKDFHSDTFSTLARNMVNLSLEQCGLTALSSGMQMLNRQAIRVMASQQPELGGEWAAASQSCRISNRQRFDGFIGRGREPLEKSRSCLGFHARLCTLRLRAKFGLTSRYTCDCIGGARWLVRNQNLENRLQIVAFFV